MGLIEMKDKIVISGAEHIGKSLSTILKVGGYDVLLFKSGAETVRIVHENAVQLVIITGVCDMSISALCERIREFSPVPIFVYSKNAEEDVVSAFENGADDFIRPAVSPRELLARIKRAVARMRHGDDSEDKYVCGDFEIDFSKRSVTVFGETICLTPTEYKITELLCRNPGSVLTHEYIMKAVWGPFVPNDNKILRVNIVNIRKKIEKDSSNPVYIKTQNGIGYVMSQA
mgnify:CR=1 FL=1